MSERWRLFIAIELPNDIIKRIERVQHQFEEQIPARAVRWVNPASIHLTLKFLGDVETDRVDRLKGALDQTAASHHPLSLEVNGTGCFPNTRRPRVLWLGLDGDQESLGRLQQSVEDSMVGLGFDPENRPFSPHLTLARVQRSASQDDARQVGLVAERGLEESVGRWQVAGLSLMRSQLKPSGAVYTELHRAALSD